MKPDLVSKFTTHLKNVLVRAYAFAHEVGDRAITTDHILWSMLMERGSLGAELLAKAKCDAEAIKTGILGRERAGASDALPVLADTTKRAIERAILTANSHDHNYVGTEHLLAGLLATDDRITLDRKFLKNQLSIVLRSTSKFPEISEEAHAHHSHAPVAVKTLTEKEKKQKKSKTPALDYFTVDLTSEDALARIDPVVGRAREIERTIEILCRRTKNNPVLLGEPGVGKTAIVEGLARRIAEGAVPEVLADKRILSLDLSLLVAGAIYRGDFEDRLKHVIEEIGADPNIILFVDELHTIVGAGSASGSLDAANILKPALARGEIRLIGATTADEYKKYIEGDAALDRRFQPVIVREPSSEETLAILRGLAPAYEEYHGVAITEDAIAAAVRLAEHHFPDRRFPDKAIDLMDEAAAAHQIKSRERPEQKKIREMTRALEAVKKEKQETVSREEYVRALELKEEELKLAQELKDLKRHAADRPEKRLKVTAEHVAAVVERATGIPAAALGADEKARLIHLDEELGQQVVGQDAVVKGVAQYLRRARAGLTDPRRPLASFLFIGPSGVGKTELARTVARTLFSAPESFIRLDMSEYAEPFATAKLIGAPPGYVGYRDRTSLTDAIRRRPYSVVLFDEIEKAHPDVTALLLQILEEATLTDASGKPASFKHAVVILTSNAGLEKFSRGTMGFSGGGEVSAKDLERDITKEAEAALRPELLNRLDRIFVFRALDAKDLERVAELEIGRLVERFEKQDVTLAVAPAARGLIASRAAGAEQGARAIRRIIQSDLESPLAERLINRESSAHSIKVDFKKGILTFTIK